MAGSALWDCVEMCEKWGVGRRNAKWIWQPLTNGQGFERKNVQIPDWMETRGVQDVCAHTHTQLSC